MHLLNHLSEVVGSQLRTCKDTSLCLRYKTRCWGCLSWLHYFMLPSPPPRQVVKYR